MKNHIRQSTSRLIIGALLGSLLHGGISHAADDTCLLNYQGVVEIEGGAYSGDGYFKFTLGDAAGTTNLWSSDGTVTGMPAASVLLDVANGFFHTMLGDPARMTPLPRSIVADTNLYLQVWFLHTLTGTYYRLGPSQLLLPVPSAVNADMIDGNDYADIVTAIYTAITIATNVLPNIYVLKAGDDMTGVLGMGNTNIVNLADGTTGDMAVNLRQLTNSAGVIYTAINDLSNFIENTMITNVANYAYLTGQVNDVYVNVTGDTMTGPLNMGNTNILNLADGTTGDMAVNLRQLTNSAGLIYTAINDLSNFIENTMITNVANYAYLTGQVNDTYVNVTGDTMTGPLNMGGNSITNLSWPTAPSQAATKEYVDAMQTNAVVSIVSGECDTNRIDVLFSTNYIVRNVCIWQPAETNQAVFLYTNDVPFATLPFAATTSYQPVNVTLGRFDRLGIASSNLNSVVQFCFEGNRQ